MTFGQTIKSLRREANMTQESLAELLSISPQAVSRWETDVAMPDISLLPPLANLFNVTTDFGNTTTKKKIIKLLCVQLLSIPEIWSMWNGSHQLNIMLLCQQLMKTNIRIC